MSDNLYNNRISVSTGTMLRFFFVAILVITAYYLLDVVLVVLSAVVIASAIEPVVRRLRRHHIHRVIAVIMVYIVAASVVATVLVFFMPVFVKESVSFVDSIPRTVSFAELWSPIQDIGISVGSSSLSAHTISLAQIVDGLQNLIVGSSDGAFRTANIIFGGFLSLILIIVLSFYLSVQEEGVDDFLRIVAPVKKHEYIINLWKRSQRKMAVWLQGQFVLGIIVGILVYIMLAIVGIPYALSLAVFAALFEIIPVFGPIISSVPAILIAFADRGAGTGALLIGLYLIIYQLESQIFYPLVVKKIVDINPIIVILALVVGAKLAGILGAIIAVPLSAALMEYVRDVEKRKTAEKEIQG